MNESKVIKLSLLGSVIVLQFFDVSKRKFDLSYSVSVVHAGKLSSVT